MFFTVRVSRPLPQPELSFHLGGVTGPGRFRFRPNEPQDRQIAALYISGSSDTFQYSAVTNSGEVVVDQYDSTQRTTAGRFYFKALRAVGTSGPECVDVRQGSFRLTLDPWSPSGCYWSRRGDGFALVEEIEPGLGLLLEFTRDGGGSVAGFAIQRGGNEAIRFARRQVVPLRDPASRW